MKTYTSLLVLALAAMACGAPDEDMDGVSADIDCDDNDNLVYPGAVEICDGIDNNCDGFTDRFEDAAVAGGNVFYVDSDGDGFGAKSNMIMACAAPDGYVSNADDCKDDDGEIYPGAPEHCDGLDENCNGTADENAVNATVWYADWDQDGFGSESLTETACEPPEGFMGTGGDCNDFDVFVNPGVDEVCDRVDNNCDGEVDEDEAVDAREWFIDADADGYGNVDTVKVACWLPDGYSEFSTDCNDDSYVTNPGAEEICRDSLDNNCNGEDDHCAVGAWKTIDDATMYFKGAASSDYLGFDLDFADMDGDGMQDLIMGAHYGDVGSISQNGAIYIQYGSDSYKQKSNKSVGSLPAFGGDESYGYAGRSVARAGDVNGDGYDDVIFGAYGDDSGGSLSGAVFLVYGDKSRVTSQTQADVSFNPTGREYAGYSVESAGDLNGDGFDEFLIGAPYSYGKDGYNYAQSTVYIIEGKSDKYDGATNLTDDAVKIHGVDARYNYMGYDKDSLASGDFDGDGDSDIVFGSYGYNGYTSYVGHAWLRYGDGTMPSGESFVDDSDNYIQADGSYTYFGRSVGSVGDINDDGYQDLAVGEYQANSYGGAAYVFFGSKTRIEAASAGDADLIIYGVKRNYIGYYAAPVGADVNGDGVQDLLLSGYSDQTGGNGAGSMTVFLGGTDLKGELYTDVDADAYVNGTGTYQYFGISLAAGDFNGDGFDDVAGGAYAMDSYAGRVMFFEGTGK